MLCGLVLHGAVEAFRAQSAKLGDGFRALAVSFDPKDTPEASRRRQALELERTGAAGKVEAWPFLTGREAEVASLASSLGFHYRFDTATGQYAHPAVIVVLTPRGRVSRYLYGVDFPAKDLRLALAEAAQGRSGASFDRFLLQCYQWDPASHRYGLAVVRFLRVGGAIVLALFLGLLARLLWRDRTAVAGGASG
jgi:protein SCO1/2